MAEGKAEDKAKGQDSVLSDNIGMALFAALTFTLMYLVSTWDYLVFHTFAELFSIVIAFGIFILAWNTRDFGKNNYLLFIGIAYLFVAFLDTLHTLAYKGMGIFKGYDEDNLPPQIWIVARYMESLSLVIAPCFFKRTLNARLQAAVYAVLTALAVLAIFRWRLFPDCFIKGLGLTDFKIVSEFLISGLLLLAIYLLYRNRERFDPDVFRYMVLALVTTIATEMAFTLYKSLYGLANLIGHYFKILSFYFVYKAVLVNGFSRPYALLFRDLKASEASLKKSLADKEMLMREINHRVKNNLLVIQSLLSLRSRQVKDEEAKGFFRESQDRVRAMSMIHERLYKSADLTSIEGSEYLRALTVQLFRSHNVDGTRVRLDMDVPEVLIDVDSIVPCALIVNELVTNAIKYAFPGDRRGHIYVGLKEEGQQMSLTVSDNGVGMPTSPANHDSLGMSIVSALVGQLDGKMDVGSPSGGGTEYVINFRNRRFR